MKILILHNAYQLRGGEDTVVEAEMELLRKAGHDVRLHLVSNNEITGPVDKFKTFLETPYAAGRRAWAADLVHSTGAEIVHVHNFFPLLTPAVHEGARAAGAAVVQTLHNYRLLCASAVFLRDGKNCEKCLKGSNLWAVVHRCYRDSAAASLAVTRMQTRAQQKHFWHNVDRFIALTESGRSTFIEGGLPPDRVVVKPNFAEKPAIEVSQTGRQGGLYIGRLASEKGAATLIEAWQLIQNEPLTVIGDGPERARLEAIAPANVRFLGHLDSNEIAIHRDRASLLFVPSVCRESFGMVAVEAFAAGLPVVASRIGALNDLIEDGVTGVLVQAGSSSELAQAAKRLFNDAEARRKMGLAAQAAYAQRFTPEANLHALESIYQDALLARLRPAH